MFACFFFAYAALRMGVASWPPLGTPVIPLRTPAINTAVISVSSLALEVGLHHVRRGRPRWLAPSLVLALALGVLFLVIQYFFGAVLFEQGLKPSSGPYGSVFYGFAGVHALHVGVGALALLYLIVQAARGKYNTPQHLPVRLWALYWHFVGIVWLLMFVFVFAL
jgi:cytochrome c oxidase subunit 3